MKQKKPPKPKDAAPMPNEEDIEREKRRKMTEIASRSGRASTILSDAGASSFETLG